MQTDYVTGGGGKAKKQHLFFYSLRESLSALIWQNGTKATAAGLRVRVCVHACTRMHFTYAPGTCRSKASRDKLCLSDGSELLKQSSSDMRRVLSSRERTRA